MKNLVVVTPIFPPAPGGAATYYDLLTRALIAEGIVHRITVITEAHPNALVEPTASDGPIRVLRLFPYRAGGTMGRMAQYWRYLWQNLLYRQLPRLVEDAQADVVLMHTSFHNQFNLLGPALRAMKRRVRLVADVRDHLLPASRLASLDIYDRLIACSTNVAAHLLCYSPVSERIDLIPIPQEPIEIADSTEAHAALQAVGLVSGRYILYAGLLKASKGVDLLLRTYERYRAIVTDPLDLALVGLIKDADLAASAQRTPGVHLSGAQARTRLLALMKHAAINVNLSASEGMPRVCLEALALGTRVILPRGIPEFDLHCPEAVAASTDDAEAVAVQLHAALGAPPTCRYPIEDHSLPRLLPLYAEALNPR